MVFKRLHGARTGIRTSLVCATAIVSVASLVHVSVARADELSDLKRQTELLERQNQALTRRLDAIEHAQRTRRGNAESVAASPQQPGVRAPGGGPTATTEALAAPPAANNGFLPPSAGGSTAPAAPTDRELRTATAAPAAASVGGTPPIPSSGLTYQGITLYGAVDLGVAYQSHGTPLSQTFGQGLEYLISKNSNRSLVSLAPNALSFSNIGLKGVEPILPDLAAVFNVQTSFLPTSGQLSNGPGSQVQDNGIALNRQISMGDSSRAGQAFNSTAYAGVSSSRFGTLTFGRQNSFTLDGVIAYDPLFASNAFSVIGYSGGPAGAGDTEDARLDSSIKYLLNIGPVRVGALYQIAGQNGKATSGTDFGGSRGDYQFDVGGGFGGLQVDGIYSQTYDSISTASLTAAQVLTAPVGSLAASVSDNQAFMVLGKYRLGALQLFAAYEDIYYHNPRDPVAAGSYGLGGIQLGVVNNAAYNNNKLLQVVWGGFRYGFTPKFALYGAYYHEHQNSYSGNGCTNTSLATCRGDLNAGSLVVDYRISPRFDVYAGAMLSTVSGGMASGFIYNTTIDPTVGARFAF